MEDAARRADGHRPRIGFFGDGYVSVFGAMPARAVSFRHPRHDAGPVL
jgi:hypothetical protein